ncbi:hypothetical protein RFI_19532 [Reticulomyxa filosa]|uniref:RGS domain-containing protein n=1 Tax=Reticulomyxa filosa TaxID=46433 RepID=X6MVW7_RETFI|nr:hypothetical protein RFI_19532 [Reticulomyxa filosa]|eukprot:ETO17781.1 hypothetical protein RFI_19532 [Reticulomyxa filosa]
MEELAMLSSQGSKVNNNGESSVQHVPLAYILSNRIGYAAFVQHCVDEINVENLFFIEQVCHFKYIFLFRTEKQYVNKSNRFELHFIYIFCWLHLLWNYFVYKNHLDLVGRISMKAKKKAGHENDREDSTDSNMATYEGEDERRFTTMAWGEEDEDQTSQVTSDIVWSPNNSLAILTFRMNRNVNKDDDKKKKDKKEANKQSDNNQDKSAFTKSDINYNSALNLHNSSHNMDDDVNEDEEEDEDDAEDNTKQKKKKKGQNDICKNRSNLHFFFHQQNLPMPSNMGSSTNLKAAANKKNGGTVEMMQGAINGADDEKSGVNQSTEHLFRLYHIFDGAWAEIWHLVTSNVYPRFVTTDHYLSIKKRLFQELEQEKMELSRIISSEDNSWFDHIKPRKLEIVGVKALPVDEQVVLFGKPVVRVKNAKL